MNGWFARSLGSTDLAEWLFLAVGVAADLVLLAVPSTATQLWQAGKRATAAAAWLIWLIVSVFAFTGGIGFASSNIADVTLARASRITPAVTTARAALNDAMAARDRECVSGVGRICRECEQAVTDRHRALGCPTLKCGPLPPGLKSKRTRRAHSNAAPPRTRRLAYPTLMSPVKHTTHGFPSPRGFIVKFLH